MSAGEVNLLDLPSVRGNPFDNRPIEASRAHDLVGRQEILHRWRDHIHSGSPRMILLVGDPGSGRTSIINTISSQTPKKYIGQYLSDDDDNVRSVLHEILTHFSAFQSIPTMNQLSQKLVSIFDEEKGPLPLIALDYPSQVININIFLSRITPILSRLRAMIIVSLTESQFSELNEDLKEIFDEPDRISNFTKNEIQVMVNNRMRLKSKEKWNINSVILESIHSSTGGNPRDVIRILKRLVDEKRDLGYQGTLENLVSWKNNSPNIEFPNIPPQTPVDEVNENTVPSIIFDYEEIKKDDITSINDDFIDVEPDDMWEDDFSIDSSDDEERFDEDILYQDEDIRVESTVNPEYISSAPISVPNTVEEPELYMEPGTEPPINSQKINNLTGLRARLAKTSSEMKKDTFDDVGITYADSDHPQSTLDHFTDDEISRSSKNTINNEKEVISEAQVDSNIEVYNYDEVINTEGGEWSVGPGFSSTLPVTPVESKSNFIDDVAPEIPESIISEYIDDSIFENIEESIELPLDTIPTLIASVAPIGNISADKSIPNFSKFSPRWEPDLPIDTNRFYSLSDAERLILEIASIREISPSDDELQARLEVGRPRLSQLYNSLHKSGILSVRKQGRTRLFKLSSAAVEEF